MNADLKEAFSRIKPVCDLVMVCPTTETITTFKERVGEMKLEAVQELQQYILFPFITHIKSEEIDKKYELQSKMADAIRSVLKKVTVNSFEMCMKIETAFLSLVFDNSKPGMVAEVPEELKLSVMRCLTTLVLKLNKPVRETLLRTQVPTLAQVVFVSVHIAKLEKLRSLRLAAIDCLTAHTATHAKLTVNYQIQDPQLEGLVVDTLSSILPGVLAALQDVATCPGNPGHAVVVSAVDAIHRVLCVTMASRHMPQRPDLTAADFARLVADKTGDKGSNENQVKYLPKRSLEWYTMAGEKLAVVTRSLVSLSVHDHYRVRKELAVMCHRILDECSATMQPSLPIALDMLISLSKDEYPEVAQYCTHAVESYLTSVNTDRNKTMDGVSDNLFAILNTLPRILNNIDSARKLSALNLLHGYVQIMCSGDGKALWSALSVCQHLHCMCNALLEAASVLPLTSLPQYATRDVSSPPPATTPWCKLRHLDTVQCEERLKDILALLGNAACAQLIADRLFDMFHEKRDPEIVYTLNWMAAAPNSPPSLAKRVINTYIEENVWYSPLEVANSEPAVTSDETLDVCVYNPRAWTKDSVPDLYEGTTETRYTDISYLAPRTKPTRDPNRADTLADAHANMLLSCSLTQGIGIMATRLKQDYQPFLLKTLCLVLERVGSKYEMLHLAGLRAINDIAAACGHSSVAHLIQHNADYFTNQVTVRLRKAWNSQSALQILSVVMEYSDASILNCLYGIVEDVLVQSCDKYYERNLDAYLQVFLTFIKCIKKWFPPEENTQTEQQTNTEINILQELNEFVKSKREEESLLNEEIETENGKSVEEMYRDYVKDKEENVLEYDDKVTNEKPPIPQHIRVSMTILKRCINFIPSPRRDECILSLEILNTGLPILKAYEDELLPLVHQAWGPLVAKFEVHQPVVLKRAFALLVTMAELAKDFIRRRTVKEVLPHIYIYLQKSALDSYLKDAGSSYRNSQEYSLQTTALAALPSLIVNLMVDGERLYEAMASASLYLSCKQPKPLQALSVQFFRTLIEYDYGATWHYLRKLCDNSNPIHPPPSPLHLEPIVGTPYESTNKDYVKNIQSIWNDQVNLV